MTGQVCTLLNQCVVKAPFACDTALILGGMSLPIESVLIWPFSPTFPCKSAKGLFISEGTSCAPTGIAQVFTSDWAVPTSIFFLQRLAGFVPK